MIPTLCWGSIKGWSEPKAWLWDLGASKQDNKTLGRFHEHRAPSMCLALRRRGDLVCAHSGDQLCLSLKSGITGARRGVKSIRRTHWMHSSAGRSWFSWRPSAGPTTSPLSPLFLLHQQRELVGSFQHADKTLSFGAAAAGLVP